jgi:glycosyltransferase involved in cell wall biosynthesis
VALVADVSVVLPVFNGQPYLSCAIESLLSQTLADFEIIVVDDGSTDNSLPILSRFARQDSRLRIIMRKNTGIETALNEGLDAARSEFIARMDADDVAMPDRLAHQLKFMQSHDRVVLLGGAYRLIDGSGRYLTTLAPPLGNSTLQTLALSGRNPFCHPLVMMRREAVLRAGGYREDLPAAEDLDLWLRLGELGELACVSEILLNYRLHARSISEQRQCLQVENMRVACQRAWERRGIQGEFKGNEPWRPTDSRASRHHFAMRYGWWAFKNRQRKTAMIYGLKAVAIDPLRSEGWRLLACALVK